MSTNDSNLNRLSKYIGELKFEDLPDEVVKNARLIISDTLGVIICGYNEEEIEKISREYIVREDKCIYKSTVFNNKFEKTDIYNSSFLNSSAACFIELDELSHSALHILPVALSIFEVKSLSYKDLITAFVCGYEVHNRINSCIKLSKGVYPHGNIGHISAFVTIAKLLKLNAHKIYKGILCAASLPLATSYAPTIYGSNIASFFSSFSGYIALQVVKLIESEEINSYEGALEDTYGNILGTNFNIDKLTSNLGETFFLKKPFFKMYPVCGMCYPSISALLSICKYNKVSKTYSLINDYNESDVDKIELFQYDDRASRVMVKAFNKYSAKFSLPFSIDILLCKGKLTVEDINLDNINSKEVESIQNKISFSVDKSLNKNFWSRGSARIRIYFKDGSQIEGINNHIFGSPNSSINTEDLSNKFINNLKNHLDKNQALNLWDDLVKNNNVENLYFEDIFNFKK